MCYRQVIDTKTIENRTFKGPTMANSMENANIQINTESLPADGPIADRVNYENQLAQSITTNERPTEIPAAKVSTGIVIISRYLGAGCSSLCL